MYVSVCVYLCVCMCVFVFDGVCVYRCVEFGWMYSMLHFNFQIKETISALKLTESPSHGGSFA